MIDPHAPPQEQLREMDRYLMARIEDVEQSLRRYALRLLVAFLAFMVISLALHLLIATWYDSWRAVPRSEACVEWRGEWPESLSSLRI